MVRKWAECEGMVPFDLHEGFEKLKKSVECIPCFSGNSLACYRGRTFQSDENPTWEQFGPPLENKKTSNKETSKGRYGINRSRVLYLCDSKNGVLSEPLNSSNELWTQKFVLPLQYLRLADIPNNLTDDYTNCVFWFSELAGNEGTNISYKFSQFVAEYFSTRFDGMIVPGVRGNNALKYRNIIIFEPKENWMNWVQKDKAPEKLRPSK